jgi:inner membrane protein
MRFPLLARFLIVGGVAVGLLLSLSMIRDKVAERRERAAEVQRTFADETSGPQVVAGPILALTCEESYVEERTVHQENGKPLTVRERKLRPCAIRLVLPRELAINSRAPVEQRYRGIYPIRLYRARMEIAGVFDLPPQPAARGEAQSAWKEAFLVLAVSDVRGIKEAPDLRLGSRTHAFMPGTVDPRLRSGLHARLGTYAELQRERVLSFQVPLELAGTARLDIAPVGTASDIRIASDWPHPSFVGAYPPDERESGAQGFTAGWRVSHLATGGNAFWLDAIAADKLFANPRLVGVALVEPVNPYSMSYRATEYGFLFVLLTFAVFCLVELIWGVRLHPVQYALTGLALSVFFLLLIALSEHIRFGLAYVAAAAACVGLLTLYLRAPLGSAGRTATFSGIFAALYGALYVLLRSEDHSLLLGSLLVFSLLAAVMLLTRRLDWSQLSSRLR